jgi:hemolysin activation/secretion protein
MTCSTYTTRFRGWRLGSLAVLACAAAAAAFGSSEPQANTPPADTTSDAPANPPPVDARAAADATTATDTTAADTATQSDTQAKAETKPRFSGSVQLDNQYSAETDPLRATLSLSFSNPFSSADEIDAAYQLAPQDIKQVSVFAASYTTHPLPDGFQPALYFIDANTNVPTSEAAGGVLGKGQIVGMRVSHALPAAGTQSLTLAAEYKHFRNLVPFDEVAELSSTEISYWGLALTYAGNWTAPQHQEGVSLSLNYGPHGGANSADAYAAANFHAQSDYFYVRADGAALFTLVKGWRLYVRAAGQYTGDSLNINEDYSIAGSDGVRGYLEAEVLGDRALKGTLQLQSPTWQMGTRFLTDAFIYADAGVAQTLQILAGEPAFRHPRSVGLGMDLVAWKRLSGTLTWARPLADADFTRENETRLLFLLRASF